MGGDAARQRAARLRARRRAKRRRSAAREGGGTRPARSQAERPRLRHRSHRPGLPRPAEDAIARSAAVIPRHERPPRRLLECGCTACHVIYANDASETSAQYAQYGNQGKRNGGSDHQSEGRRTGHPIKHQITRSIPSSQCMTCHMHPGTNMVATYYGYTWWDNETDGKHMYPAERSNRRRRAAGISSRNPGSGARACGAIRSSSAQSARRTSTRSCSTRSSAIPRPRLGLPRRLQARPRATCSTRTKDRPADDPDEFGKAVHLKDIHLENGMHCVDCHFGQDNHGNGKLYNEPRNAVRSLHRLPRLIDQARDTHHHRPGRASRAQPPRRAPHTKARAPLRREGDRLYQRSMVDPGLKWEVVQTVDTITPGRRLQRASRYAKTVQRDGRPGATSAAVTPTSSRTPTAR